MKTCPKCEKEHEKNGKFCSRTCANSRTFSQESNEKRGQSLKRFHDNLSDVELRERSEKIKASAKASGRKLGRPALDIVTASFDELGKHKRKARVLLEQEGKCLHCGLEEHWNGGPLVLQLDHINGDNRDNRRENLRCLCPNCHSQTPTYALKKVHMMRKMATHEGLEPPTADS